jgi:integral membrane protein (TIGR00529 family)
MIRAMDILFSVPYLGRIMASLLGILVFQKLTKSLSAALVAGSLIIALWTGHSPAAMGGIAFNRIFSLDTLFLALVVAGVIWLSSLMSEAGMMKDLVSSLRSRLSRKNILAVLPAVVGLLPMPAGALFSAPLLDDADGGKTLTQMQKTRINYWFRHVWEFWWPLYPGVLLAVDMSGLPIWKLVCLMMPLFFAASGAGYVFLLRRLPSGKAESGTEAAPGKAFFPLILPTVTVIAVYGVLLVTVPALGHINKYLPMVIGIVCGIAVLQIQRPASVPVWKKVLASKRTLSLVVIVVLARVYGAFIEAKLPGGALLMESLRTELNAFGIPVILLIIIIPFVSGLTTGITVGYIGASFPVVLSLAGPDTGGLFATIALGYGCGFIGMMLSPIHVCLIVTNEYYKTNLFESLSGLLRPALFVFVCAAAYSFGWSFFP